MSTVRSPPPQQGDIERVCSEPNLNVIKDTPLSNITFRNASKRMRSESNNSPANTEFMAAMSAQDTKLDSIMNFMRDMRAEMGEMCKSMEFMSNKYEELQSKYQIIEQERKEDQKVIMNLEYKIDVLERQTKSTTLEIKNIPQATDETKEQLFEIVRKMTSAVKVSISKSDIKNTYRVSTKDPKNKPIIVELMSNLKKEEILKSIKLHNKKSHDDKLSTNHLMLEGPKQPVYVTESLTHKNRRLYAMARVFAREHKYNYHWTSQGTVFIKKGDGHAAVRITDEKDLSNLIK